MILGCDSHNIFALKGENIVKKWEEGARKVSCLGKNGLAVLRENEIFFKTPSQYFKVTENGSFYTNADQLITANTKMLEVYNYNQTGLNRLKSIPLKVISRKFKIKVLGG